MSVSAEGAVVGRPFVDWLQQRLDALGLDAPLYARCITQLCTQPTATQPDELSSCEYGLGRVRSYSALGGGGRLSSFDHLFGAEPTVNGQQLQQSLQECLQAVGLNKSQIEEFATEIVDRYSEQQFLGLKSFGKQNESIDSGVCPSPEGSFQNYDEAFPPLCDDSLTDLGVDDGQLVCQAPPDPAALPKPNFLELPVENGSSAEWLCADGDGREVRSCPHDVFTFNRSSHLSGTTPQFVVPKCHTANASAKVGSCPARLEFGYSFGPQSGSSCGCVAVCAADPSCAQHHPTFVLHVINNEQPCLQDELPALSSQCDEFAMDLGCSDGQFQQFCLPLVHSDNNVRPTDHPQPPSVGSSVVQVPISAETHFQPIRCESMLGAFEPPMVQSDYAVDYWGSEQYFVLRDRPLSAASSRSIQIKFKAVRPDCQTQTSHDDQLPPPLSTIVSNYSAQDSVPERKESCQSDRVWGPLDPLSPLSNDGSTVDWPLPKPKPLGVGSTVWQSRRSANRSSELEDSWNADELPTLCDRYDPPSKELLAAAENEDNELLSYVGNISLLSPLEPN